MSYLFQSRQLHPRYCGLGLGTIGRGMGLVGPDQPWTAENAGKVIAQPTRECPAGNEKSRTNERTRPKTVIDGSIVDNPDCFQTGKVIEASKAGKARWIEWCCPPKREKLPKRWVTQPEKEQYLERCEPYVHNGIVKETYPMWVGPNTYISGSCNRPGIFDEGYELICCPDLSVKGPLVLPEQTFVQATPTAEQEAEFEARKEERQLEQEQAAAAAAPPPVTFIERYGFALLLVGGAVGLGVTAALFKRFSVAAKKAEESKAAIAAMQAQQGES